MKCKKCGNKALLATAWVNEFISDEEPYENGKKEEPRIVDRMFMIPDTVCVIIDYCEKCDEVISMCSEK